MQSPPAHPVIHQFLPLTFEHTALVPCEEVQWGGYPPLGTDAWI